MKHDFDRPAFLVQFGHFHGRRFTLCQVREYMQFRASVPSWLVQVDRDSSHRSFATVMRQLQLLLVGLFAARRLADLAMI